jgi:superfamily II DNA or RNA helicase
MRFGKTFTSYQLAKKLGAKRVLVLTFAAVEDAWQTDLESHVDFDGWRYQSRNVDGDPREVRQKRRWSIWQFQDLLGRDPAGNIKPRNEWIHTINWDLVVFDEYHFGACARRRRSFSRARTRRSPRRRPVRNMPRA